MQPIRHGAVVVLSYHRQIVAEKNTTEKISASRNINI